MRKQARPTGEELLSLSACAEEEFDINRKPLPSSEVKVGS